VSRKTASLVAAPLRRREHASHLLKCGTATQRRGYIDAQLKSKRITLVPNDK
jgi:sulfur relay (sulfurtransferase) complex TusBCD TusD component (DsrE family)